LSTACQEEKKGEEPVTEEGIRDVECGTSFYDIDFSLGGDDDDGGCG
jgi:hypothetical protein